MKLDPEDAPSGWRAPSHQQLVDAKTFTLTALAGTPWNIRAVLCDDGAPQGAVVQTEVAHAEINFESGTRYPRRGVVEIQLEDQPALRLTYEPKLRFQMSGLGYHHPRWGHGRYLAPLAVEREDFTVSEINPADPTQLHVQAVSFVTVEQNDEVVDAGVGVFESFAIGPYEPYGLTGISDGASG